MIREDKKNGRSGELDVPLTIKQIRSMTQPVRDTEEHLVQETEKDSENLDNICVSLGVMFPEPTSATLAAAAEFEEILKAEMIKQSELSSQEDTLSMIEDAILGDKDQLNQLIKAGERYANEKTLRGRSLVVESFNLNRYEFIVTNFIEGKYKKGLNSLQTMQINKFVMELFKQTMKVSSDHKVNSNAIRTEFEENGGKYLCCSDKSKCKWESAASLSFVKLNPMPLMSDAELSQYMEIFKN